MATWICGPAGCASDYAADVANHAQRPVFAAIFEQSPRLGARRLANVSVAPGDEKSLGPVKPSDAGLGAAVFIIIDSTPNPRSPRRIPLSRGLTRFEVVQFGDDPRAPIQVNQLP